MKPNNFHVWLAEQERLGKVIHLDWMIGEDGKRHLTQECIDKLKARFDFRPLFELCYPQQQQEEPTC